jgi:large subunit ribosomal protein L14e
MFNVGQLCMKIAGRDAGKRCVVVEVDNGLVLVDGETRRRKVSLKHLEPLQEIVEISEGASHADVKSALKKLDIHVLDTKPKKKGARPKKVRKVKVKPVKQLKTMLKTEGKTEKKESETSEKEEVKSQKSKHSPIEAKDIDKK